MGNGYFLEELVTSDCYLTLPLLGMHYLTQISGFKKIFNRQARDKCTWARELTWNHVCGKTQLRH